MSILNRSSCFPCSHSNKCIRETQKDGDGESTAYERLQGSVTEERGLWQHVVKGRSGMLGEERKHCLRRITKVKGRLKNMRNVVML